MNFKKINKSSRPSVHAILSGPYICSGESLEVYMIVHDLLFYSEVFTIIKQYILHFNQIMLSEFVFGIIVTPFTKFYVMYRANCLHNKMMQTRVLKNQHNFISYLIFQKRQYFYLIKIFKDL